MNASNVKQPPEDTFKEQVKHFVNLRFSAGSKRVELGFPYKEYLTREEAYRFANELKCRFLIDPMSQTYIFDKHES